jgi:imidazolonepropionase-like amidohydrolase
MAQYLFRNLNLLDPNRADLLEGFEVLVEGERIKEVSDKPIRSTAAAVVECGRRTLMPGLIDAHVHTFHSEVNVRRMEEDPLTLMTARGIHNLRRTLDRGFTTVRDTGGGDWGIRAAVEQGLVVGPRLFICGRVISMTGGHGDSRRRTQANWSGCFCCNALDFTRSVVDGVPEVLRAVREELRKGADHVKMHASGGVASPNDPLEGLQFTSEEIKAIVEETKAWDSYALAHAYSADAIYRAVDLGVRSIEHGNLIDRRAAELMAARGAFIVPTLVTYDAMRRRGQELGMTKVSMDKNAKVLAAGLKSLEICKAAGVKMGFGTDLLGALRDEQAREFLIRAEVLSPREILYAATVANAELLRRSGDLGVVRPGALADLLVVDGNPLKDLGLFQDQGRHLAVIMKGGELHKNRLN